MIAPNMQHTLRNLAHIDLIPQHLCRSPFFRLPATSTSAEVQQHLRVLAPAVVLTTQALAQQHSAALTHSAATVLISSSPAEDAELGMHSGGPQAARIPCTDLCASQRASQGASPRDVPALCSSAAATVLECHGRARQLAPHRGECVCIVVTSGSTGAPKYVALGALGLLHRLTWNATRPSNSQHRCGKFEPADATKALQPTLLSSSVVAVKTSEAFVDSLWELFAPLAFGVCVVCCLLELHPS